MDKLTIVKKIIEEIDSVFCLFGVESYNNFTEEDPTGFNLYIKGDYGYIPYTLRFDFKFDQDELLIHYHISVIRFPIGGNKSDIYVLWGALLPLIMKVIFDEENIVRFQEHMFVDREIGGACILFSKDVLKFSNTYAEGEIGALIYKFIQAQSLIEFYFGSISNRMIIHSDKPTFFFRKYKNSVTIRREEHLFEWNGNNCFHFVIENGKCNFDEFYNAFKIQSELFDYFGIGFLKQNIDGKITKKYLSKNTYNKLCEILKLYKISNVKLICQENILYILSKSELFIIIDDFTYDRYVRETYFLEKIERRKNQFLGNKYIELDWKYPVNPALFECLIKDLLEEDNHNMQVRNCGNVNNADGGKDLLFYRWNYNESKARYEQQSILGQCKAYRRSVNKSDITDIRDRLDEYNAKGFFLAVTEKITSRLIDYLIALRNQGYYIDWWTKEEIFSRLQTKSNLLKKYEKIIKINGSVTTNG